MTDTTNPTTEPASPAAPESVDHSGASAQEAAPTAKSWDGDFDPQRAQKLIENLRSDIEKLKNDKRSYAEKLKAYEDAEKSEFQKLQEQVQEYEAQLRELTREKVALKHGLSEDLLEFVSGETVEEMEERARRLAEKLAPKKDETPTSSRPTPKLVPGTGAPDDAPITREALKTMAPEKVMELMKQGALRHLLGGQ